MPDLNKLRRAAAQSALAVKLAERGADSTVATNAAIAEKLVFDEQGAPLFDADAIADAVVNNQPLPESQSGSIYDAIRQDARRRAEVGQVPSAAERLGMIRDRAATGG